MVVLKPDPELESIQLTISSPNLVANNWDVASLVIFEGKKICAFIHLIMNEYKLVQVSPLLVPTDQAVNEKDILFFLLLLYSKRFPTDIRSCALLQLARCYLSCFCLMHFNTKVLKHQRERCSAVYKALLYSVLKIV